MRGSSLLFAVGSTAFVAASCNAITGVADIIVATDDDGGTTRVDGGGGDGGAGRSDAGTNVIPPSLTSCGEQRVCLPVEGGWRPELYLQLVEACPQGWPTRNVARTSGGGRCDCECTPTPSSACTGSVLAYSGADCGTATPPIDLDLGECEPNAQLPSPVKLEYPSNIARATSCAGTPKNELAEPREAVSCSGAAPLASDVCRTGEQCFAIPEAIIPFSHAVCIASEGDVACPASLPRKILVGATVHDGRDCGPTCTCSTTDCSGGEVDVYEAASCSSGAPRTVPIDGRCRSVTTSGTHFMVRPNACSVAARPEIVGQEIVVAARTLCCTLL